MPSGYVKFKHPVILHSGLYRFSSVISKSEYRILEENGYLFRDQEMPDELMDQKIYFYEKYQTFPASSWIAYIIHYRGYKIAITSYGGPLEEDTNILPDHLFEI